MFTRNVMSYSLDEGMEKYQKAIITLIYFWLFKKFPLK